MFEVISHTVFVFCLYFSDIMMTVKGYLKTNHMPIKEIQGHHQNHPGVTNLRTRCTYQRRPRTNAWCRGTTNGIDTTTIQENHLPVHTAVSHNRGAHPGVTHIQGMMHYQTVLPFPNNGHLEDKNQRRHHPSIVVSEANPNPR